MPKRALILIDIQNDCFPGRMLDAHMAWMPQPRMPLDSWPQRGGAGIWSSHPP